MFARTRSRGLSEARIQEISGGRGREFERALLVGVFVYRPMVGQARHFAPWAAQSVVGDRRICPIGLEPKLSVGKAKAVEEVRSLERRLQVQPTLCFERCEVAVARRAQRPIDDLSGR